MSAATTKDMKCAAVAMFCGAELHNIEVRWLLRPIQPLEDKQQVLELPEEGILVSRIVS